MACPLCGDRCTCSSPAHGAAIAGTGVSVLIEPSSEPQGVATAAYSRPQKAEATAQVGKDFYRSGADWRDEVSNRVQAHKARRRRRFDPEQSLSLAFNPATSPENPHEGDSRFASQYQQTSSALELEPPSFRDASERSSADASFHDATFEDATPGKASRGEENFDDARPSPYRRILLKQPISADSAAEKVIQFPRSAEQERLFTNELAEPIFGTPRILDSPENAPETEPAPQMRQPLANFHLDDYLHETDMTHWQSDDEDDSQIELPLQVAPVGARTMCALTDAVVVMTAAALFSVIVLSIAKFVPQGRAAAAIALLLPLTLWAAYHYLFLVYAGRTPGMQMAQLELSSFEGCVPTRSVRGWRAISMMLSCTSLGLGFAWAMVDEDRLSWHDRITRTYLRQS